VTFGIEGRGLTLETGRCDPISLTFIPESVRSQELKPWTPVRLRIRIWARRATSTQDPTLLGVLGSIRIWCGFFGRYQTTCSGGQASARARSSLYIFSRVCKRWAKTSLSMRSLRHSDRAVSSSAPKSSWRRAREAHNCTNFKIEID
jgi:hypothetical protein